MKSVGVLDSTMSFVEDGAGTPVVFLHGNPTSSFLWRRVLPGLTGMGRLLAPDLIGMGASGKPPIDYRFVDHVRYLDAWFDHLDLHEVVLVGHDWGAALAFDWARRHADRVRGVAFMETIVKPMAWKEFPEPAQDLFRSIRTRGVGEAMILDENVFIEQALRATIASGLSDDDLAVYREPYPTRESRLPLLQWARSMPLDGEPAEVVARVHGYDRWLADSPDVPKLLLSFEPGPGTMLGPGLVDWCSASIAGLEIHHCGPAGHHAPEDQPDAIAGAIRAWLERHRLIAGAAADGTVGEQATTPGSARPPAEV